MQLLHVTACSRLDKIAAEGLNPGSYWTCDEAMAAYYAQTVRDDGEIPSILTLRLQDLPADALAPDRPGIDEPITTVLSRTEETIRRDWSRSARNWQASLEIIWSLRCNARIAPRMLQIKLPDGGLRQLINTDG